ncbi:MAG TPA: acyl-CoA dehydrogenase family protein, partial [Anaerolineae bacterium]|nr:acyl-CoA dehydrogenase family protein [Anaerolineae bacterium]
MLEAILSPTQKQLRTEVRAFVKEIPRQLVLDMDADRIRYPREFVEKAAGHNLLGLRFPIDDGGRALTWADEIVALEEVGVLGTSLA